MSGIAEYLRVEVENYRQFSIKTRDGSNQNSLELRVTGDFLWRFQGFEEEPLKSCLGKAGIYQFDTDNEIKDRSKVFYDSNNDLLKVIPYSTSENDIEFAAKTFERYFEKLKETNLLMSD